MGASHDLLQAPTAALGDASIGIVGGGQLAWMLAEAARSQGAIDAAERLADLVQKVMRRSL